jgi:apolipoprotein N-acyltransferase
MASSKYEGAKGSLLAAPFWVKLLLCLGAGIGLSFIQAPYHLWWLLFPCFSLFYICYAGLKSPAAVFACTFAFAIGYFVTGLNWIGNALLVEGNEFRWVWPIAVIALPTLLSLFYALYAMLAHHYTKRDSLIGFCVFVLSLTFAEFVRGYVFSGFPWNLFSYGWIAVMPMAQAVSLLGPFGLSLLSVAWGALPGYLFLRGRGGMAPALGLVIFFVGLYGFGAWRLAGAEVIADKSTQIVIVQPNIAQEFKWDPDQVAANFRKHIDLSRTDSTAEKKVIIWPETAIPPTVLNSVEAAAQFKEIVGGNTILLAGGLSVLPDEESLRTEYHNALYLFDGENEPQRLYNKSNLVPFGEFIPFQEYIPLTPVVSFTGFQRGDGAQTISVRDFPSFSPQICYEIIFPNRAVDSKDKRPDYILTVTNDAWYGDSPGPRQHFSIARFRAIEQGMAVVRSANTGISGIIDPYGRVIEKTELLQDDTIVAALPRPLVQRPLYSYYGDSLFLLVVLIGTSGVILLRKKPSNPRSH